MEWRSTLKYARISARKARLVADLIRGMNVSRAGSMLRFTPKKAAGIIKKVLDAAVQSASRSAGVDVDKLYVNTITVDEGPTAKRWMPRAMGRATRIRKRTSHIHVEVTDKD
jgi:large subunit ribosomal protein L22